jgi:hypothetical protein
MAITLLEAIEALYPLMMLIHVFLGNARYHLSPGQVISRKRCCPADGADAVTSRIIRVRHGGAK